MSPSRKDCVLVTGGAGFIGSHLVDRLVHLRYRVTVIDDLSSGKRSNLNAAARFVRMDIRSQKLDRVVGSIRPAAVFHLAAQKNVRMSIESPALDADVNITGSLNLLEACRQHRVRNIIFSSTGGALYGDGVRLPTPESAQPHPLSPYGIAKYAVEQYLAFYAQQFGIRTCSLRYANVYGPRQDPKGEAGVVAIFSKRLLRGKPLLIFGTGRQTRDYVYVSDVVDASIAAMRGKTTGEINIGTGVQTSVNTLAHIIMQQSRTVVKKAHVPAIPGEAKKSALAWRKAKALLGWVPTISLNEGILSTIEWASRELH